MFFQRTGLLCLWIALLPLAAQPEVNAPAQDQALAVDIFRQLIEINTTHSVGSVTAAAEAMRTRLLAGGFSAGDVDLAGPSERKQNLIVHYRGAGKAKTIVVFAHLDVVEAIRSDWSVDPFHLLEKDGYYYGRGTQDIKQNDAIAVETFLRLKREGYRPPGDLLLLLTADEEAGPDDGVPWLLANRPALFRDVAFTLNLDAGDLSLKEGKATSMGYEASEKEYADFELKANDPGGHSSLPHAGNPIERIADGLVRLQAAPFPLELSPVVKDYFAQVVAGYDPATRALVQAVLVAPQNPAALRALAESSPFANAVLRTTCIPTRFAGGHANNALPNAASANINCRILPGHSPAEVQEHIVRALNDPAIAVRYCDSTAVCGTAPATVGGAAVGLLPQVAKALNEATAQVWPGIPVVGVLETGATDSIYMIKAGLPTYGMTGVGIDKDDVRAHGKDERIRVAAFARGLEFFYLLLRGVSPAPSM